MFASVFVHAFWLVTNTSGCVSVGLTPGNDSTAAEASSWGSQSETHSMDSDSDRTYILQETEPSVSESDSYMTAETLHGSTAPATGMSGKDSLMQELRDLRCATPLKEMSGQIERWISTGVYMERKPSGSASVAGAASSTVSGRSMLDARLCFVIRTVLLDMNGKRLCHALQDRGCEWVCVGLSLTVCVCVLSL